MNENRYLIYWNGGTAQPKFGPQWQWGEMIDMFWIFDEKYNSLSYSSSLVIGVAFDELKYISLMYLLRTK